MMDKHEIYNLALRGREMRLSLTALGALAYLGTREGPVLLSELARALHCTPAAVTAMMDGLERAGLATRGTADDDRRKTPCALTHVAREWLDAPDDTRGQ